MAGSATVTGVQYYTAGIGHPNTPTITEEAPAMAEYVVGGENNGSLIVISSAAPVNGDGRPNGTIYIQTT